MCHQTFYHPHPDSDGFIVGTASIRGDRSPHECTRIEITDGRECITLNFIHNKNGHKETFLETLQAAVQEELDNLRSKGLTAYQPMFPEHTCGTILTPNETYVACDVCGFARPRSSTQCVQCSTIYPDPFDAAAFDAEMGDDIIGQEVHS